MMFVCFLMLEGMVLMDDTFMFLHSGNVLLLQPSSCLIFRNVTDVDAYFMQGGLHGESGFGVDFMEKSTIPIPMYQYMR
jgi:hypothetical protein